MTTTTLSPALSTLTLAVGTGDPAAIVAAWDGLSPAERETYAPIYEKVATGHRSTLTLSALLPTLVDAFQSNGWTVRPVGKGHGYYASATLPSGEYVSITVRR